ncbi:PhoH family protein [Oecophyllibacter saccharovorans]|nr:PhoH family protein [Oecophyllibacter saccharovorans]TPW34747.1 PhoH family protein [Oecophyllibacter saccharovorans]
MTRYSPSSRSSTARPDGEQRTLTLRFEDNALLQRILGEHDRNLARLEDGLNARLSCRGNRVAISGPSDAVDQAQAALLGLYRQAEQGESIGTEQVDAILRLLTHPSRNHEAAASSRPRPLQNGTPSQGAPAKPARDGSRSGRQPIPSSSRSRKSAGPGGNTASADLHHLPTIQTKRGVVSPRSHGQTGYMEELGRQELVFGIGPAGTGKTYLAVAQAVAMLQAGQVDRIILSRPAVEAGEKLGFLPGDMREKIDPYLRPLYDALHDMMPAEQITRRMGNGEIEVAPLAFMRGRTLAHAYVILDEAQNTTPAQMKMFLTRMGPNTRMAITGDISQIDLPPGVTSGLKNALHTLEGVEGISICHLTSEDVVRHPLVARIVDAYDRQPPEEPTSRNTYDRDEGHQRRNSRTHGRFPRTR